MNKTERLIIIAYLILAIIFLTGVLVWELRSDEMNYTSTNIRGTQTKYLDDQRDARYQNITDGINLDNITIG